MGTIGTSELLIVVIVCLAGGLIPLTAMIFIWLGYGRLQRIEERLARLEQQQNQEPRA